jgi:predicted kinase
MTPRLLAVIGLPGVGKTTVAREFTDRLDARLIRTDTVRTDCFADPAYTPAERRRVYAELFIRARDTVDRGRSVVLDGTFRKRTDRERAVELAASTGATLGVVVVECEAPVVESRIAAREDDASDADIEVYREFRDRYDPVRLPHATVDNSGPMAATRAQAMALLGDD